MAMVSLLLLDVYVVVRVVVWEDWARILTSLKTRSDTIGPFSYCHDGMEERWRGKRDAKRELRG